MDTSAFKETAETISLHGLGFLQVKLGGNQRLHVWHPGLPRRACFEHSAIHDHRFGFNSTVLVGMQVNDLYAVYEPGVANVPDTLEPTHQAYLHEGERSQFGNRPWIPRERVWVPHVNTELVEAGKTYRMLPHVFHATRAGGDGRVATLMTKIEETSTGARSLCTIGVEPDVDFDRRQLTEDEMWDVVRDVLGG